MIEIWKDIKEFIGDYQISSLGRIKSFLRSSKGKILKNIYPTRLGYLRARLCKDSERCYYSIHRLVGKAFIDNPDNKPQINHIDGNKLNNKVENLEWCTAAENTQHAFRTGLKRGFSGEKNSQAILTEFQVKRMRLMKEVDPKLSYMKIGKLFGVHGITAMDAVKGRTWSHIT